MQIAHRHRGPAPTASRMVTGVALPAAPPIVQRVLAVQAMFGSVAWLRSLVFQGVAAGDLVSLQPLFLVERHGDQAKLIPANSAATSIAASKTGALAVHRLTSLIDLQYRRPGHVVLHAVALTAGTAPINDAWTASARRRIGYLAAIHAASAYGLLSVMGDLATQDRVDYRAFMAGVEHGTKRQRAAFARQARASSAKSDAFTSRYVQGGLLIIGGNDASLLETPAPNGTRADPVSSFVTEVLDHELQHAVSPLSDSPPPASDPGRLRWLEEAIATRIADWRGERERAADAMRLPPPIESPLDPNDSYTPWVQQLDRILALAGLSPTRSEDFHAAQRLLQTVPTTQLPRVLAVAIGRRHHLTSAQVRRLTWLIQRSTGSAAQTDAIAAASGSRAA